MDLNFVFLFNRNDVDFLEKKGKLSFTSLTFINIFKSEDRSHGHIQDMI